VINEFNTINNSDSSVGYINSETFSKYCTIMRLPGTSQEISHLLAKSKDCAKLLFLATVMGKSVYSLSVQIHLVVYILYLR